MDGGRVSCKRAYAYDWWIKKELPLLFFDSLDYPPGSVASIARGGTDSTNGAWNTTGSDMTTTVQSWPGGFYNTNSSSRLVASTTTLNLDNTRPYEYGFSVAYDFTGGSTSTDAKQGFKLGATSPATNYPMVKSYRPQNQLWFSVHPASSGGDIDLTPILTLPSGVASIRIDAPMGSAGGLETVDLYVNDQLFSGGHSIFGIAIGGQNQNPAVLTEIGNSLDARLFSVRNVYVRGFSA